jgi:hypothetical protein
MLPEHVTEGVGANAAQETGLPAQPGKAHSDVAGGAARPGVEMVVTIRNGQQIDERFPRYDYHSAISPVPQAMNVLPT